MVQETRNKKQETRNKKQETRNPYGSPEWEITRLTLVMPVLSGNLSGVGAEGMGTQEDDDEWN